MPDTLATPEDAGVETQPVVAPQAEDLDEGRQNENQPAKEDAAKQPQDKGIPSEVKTYFKDTMGLGDEDVAALKEKWNITSDEKVYKKILHLEKHNSQLQGESKKQRDQLDAFKKSAERVGDLQGDQYDDLKKALAPVTANVKREKEVVQVKQEIQVVIQNDPEAAEFAEDLLEWAFMPHYLKTSVDDIWKSSKKLLFKGSDRGAESEAAKIKASVGRQSGSTPAAKPKVVQSTGRQILRGDQGPKSWYPQK